MTAVLAVLIFVPSSWKIIRFGQGLWLGPLLASTLDVRRLYQTVHGIAESA